MVARTGLFVAPLPGSTPAGSSPTDGRLVLGAVFGTGPGCLFGGALTASATQMQVTVAAAVWRIPDPTNAAGVYLSPGDPATFTFSAGPASGSRIDVLWVRQNNFEAGDADSRVTYGVAAGTAASTPTEPAVPAGAMKIGKLTVPTSASNAAACTLVPSYPGALLLAPQLAVGTEPQLPAVGSYIGQLAYVASVTVAGATFPCIERWNGSAWKQYDSDWVTVPGGSGTASIGVSYTTCRFRFRAGKVVFNVASTVTSVGSGLVQFTLPVNSDSASLPMGEMFVTHSSTPYPMSPAFASNTALAMQYYQGSPPVSNNHTTAAPFTPATGDKYQFEIEYTPA